MKSLIFSLLVVAASAISFEMGKKVNNLYLLYLEFYSFLFLVLKRISTLGYVLTIPLDLEKPSLQNTRKLRYFVTETKF